MKHINQFGDPNMLSSQVNSFLAGKGGLIAEAISYESIVNEAALLNRAESVVPADVRLSIELDMLLKEGNKAITHYYKQLLEGRNIIIEKAKRGLSNLERQKLNESYKTIVNKFKVINEQAATIPTDAADIEAEYGEEYTDVINQMSDHSEVPGADGEDGGILSMLGNLLDSITEGGSPIGIIHLILDVIGLFGDAFTVVGLPLGLIADVLNGLIYLVRGKWLLATISFIAAIIPFGGDAAKLFKGGAKTMDDVMKVSAKSGGTEMTKGAVDVLMAAKPAERASAIKGLDYISKSAKGAVGKVSEIISKFFDSFLGTVSSYIPLIGGPLSKFFKSIGSKFSRYAEKMGKFADDIPLALKEANKLQVDEFFKAAGKEGTLMRQVKGTSELQIIDKNTKKVLAVMDARVLKESGSIAKKYPAIADSVLKHEDDIAHFYANIAKLNKETASIYGTVVKGVKNTFKYSISLAIFVGKQIVKVMGDAGDQLSEVEIEALGNASLQQSMQDKIKECMDEHKDRAYCVPYVDALTDPELTKELNANLDYYARRFGQPRIIDVVYYTSGGKDKMPKDVEDFFNMRYEDTPEKFTELDKLIDEMGTGKKVSESRNYTHIRPFKL